MKKSIIVFLGTLLILSFQLELSSAGNHDARGKKININVPFKFQIYENGKPTEKFMVGSMQIYNYNDNIQIHWSDVLISPLHSQKIVLLKAEEYNSEDHVYENVSVNEDKIIFTMILPPYANRINIQATKGKGKLFHAIRGQGIFRPLYSGDNPGSVEWRQVEKVILPYKEVY